MNFVLLGRSPPCMHMSKTVATAPGEPLKSRNHGVSHMRLLAWFSQLHLVPALPAWPRKPAVNSYSRLAVATLSSDTPASPGKPSGCNSDLSGVGLGAPKALRRIGTGRSRAREAVPRGGAAWT